MMAITLITDVSHYQGTIDWAAVARTPYRAGVARMTIGRTTKDDLGRRNLHAMLDTMPVAGAYGVVGYSEPVTDGAKFLLDEIAAAGADPAKILVMLDAEDFSDGRHPTIEQVDAYARQLHADLGRWVVSYTPDWWLDRHGYSVAGRALANCPWAPSEYFPAPWTEERLVAHKPTSLHGYKTLGWLQFTSSATIAGISGRADANCFYGTLDELRAQLLGQEDLMLDTSDKEWFIKQFTAGEEGVTLRTAVWELIVRAVNSAFGNGTSRAAIDKVMIGDGSPARQGVADVVGGLPVELDVTQLTPDQLAMVAEVFAGKVVITGVQAKAGQFTVTFEPA